MVVAEIIHRSDDFGVDDGLFAAIAEDLQTKGYSIKPSALPPELAGALGRKVAEMTPGQFERAGIGRDVEHRHNNFVRSDEICWVNGDSEAGEHWLRWAGRLQTYLNRRLFLGLFSFESHFAHYAPGDFYRRHMDAFRGEANRKLTVISYLNSDWLPEHGGELVLYCDAEDTTGVRVKPGFGTLVVFLSEEFPHEVLPAARDRYSIVGWFRVNSSSSDRTDPPC